MGIDTPQRRKRIVQLVRNDLPDCEVEFTEDVEDVLAFRIRSSSGKYRTGTITLRCHHIRIVLNKAWLQQQIDEHGGPHVP